MKEPNDAIVLSQCQTQQNSVAAPRSCKAQPGTNMVNNKNELQSLLGITNRLGKFLSSTTEVCEPFTKLVSLKCEWTWNNTFQNLYDRAKNMILKNATIAFYSEKEQLFLETDALHVGLGATSFGSKERNVVLKE